MCLKKYKLYFSTIKKAVPNEKKIIKILEHI